MLDSMTERAPMTAAPSALMSVAEIAADLRKHPEAVRRMLKRGIIPNVRDGRGWIVAREAYEKWKGSCGMERVHNA